MIWRAGILSAGLALAGCGDNSELSNRAIDYFTGDEAQQPEGTVFPRFQPLIAAKDGPAIEVRIPAKDVRGGLLLESRQGNIESWLGTDGSALTFDRGVLHGTRGVGAGMLASDVSASATAILSGRGGEVERVHTFLNANNETVIRAYTCTVTNGGAETTRLDIGNVRTRLMREECRNLDQRFTNLYYVDPARGRIVKSSQWSGDFLGQMEITTVYNY